MSLSICPRSQGCTAALAWVYFSGTCGVVSVWMSQTNYQGHSGNSPESGSCTLWVKVGESLEKIMSCKIPIGPCKHKGDDLPLVFRKIYERDSASAFSGLKRLFSEELEGCFTSETERSKLGKADNKFVIGCRSPFETWDSFLCMFVLYSLSLWSEVLLSYPTGVCRIHQLLLTVGNLKY